MLKRLTGSTQFFYLYILHIFNDCYHASLLLLLPFIAQDLGLNLTQAGLLGTLANSLSIVFAIPAGHIAAKIGGYKALVLALFLYSLGFIGTGASQSYFALFPMFLLAGAGFGMFHPIGFALIAKLSNKETRGKNMGNFTAIGDIGKIGLAALLTLIIVSFGWQATALLYGLISTATAILFVFLLKKKREHFSAHEKSTTQVNLREILANKRFISVALAGFFDAFASSSLFIFLPFLLLKRGADPVLLGSFAAVYFIGNFAGKALLGRLVDRYGNTKVFIVSEILMALFILILANSTFLPVIIIASIVLGIFTKGTVPVLSTMVSDAVEHHGNYEKAFGVGGFFSSSATTLAPVLLGFLSDKFGIVSAFTTMAAMALIAIIPTLFFHFSKAHK